MERFSILPVLCMLFDSGSYAASMVSKYSIMQEDRDAAYAAKLLGRSLSAYLITLDRRFFYNLGT